VYGCKLPRRSRNGLIEGPLNMTYSNKAENYAGKHPVFTPRLVQPTFEVYCQAPLRRGGNDLL